MTFLELVCGTVGLVTILALIVACVWSPVSEQTAPHPFDGSIPARFHTHITRDQGDDE